LWIGSNIRRFASLPEGDLSESERKVLPLEGRSLAYYYKCPFIEVSAKSGANVAEAFRLLVQQFLSFQSKLKPTATNTKPKKKVKEGATHSYQTPFSFL
jgi:hypothetical protein